jgi:hypothetical protein
MLAVAGAIQEYNIDIGPMHACSCSGHPRIQHRYRSRMVGLFWLFGCMGIRVGCMEIREN